MSGKISSPLRNWCYHQVLRELKHTNPPHTQTHTGLIHLLVRERISNHNSLWPLRFSDIPSLVRVQLDCSCLVTFIFKPAQDVGGGGWSQGSNILMAEAAWCRYMTTSTLIASQEVFTCKLLPSTTVSTSLPLQQHNNPPAKKPTRWIGDPAYLRVHRYVSADD